MCKCHRFVSSPKRYPSTADRMDNEGQKAPYHRCPCWCLLSPELPLRSLVEEVHLLKLGFNFRSRAKVQRNQEYSISRTVTIP
ncbi:unnamed protein product [Haemonchus placei]|uniref:Uncharacterized protein n=1 Tax=Haemonchus placei TaxID=6290 RepID=A0A3P7XSF2_HAEPC|nr:unnamed protein product [Haemonchus placei]